VLDRVAADADMTLISRRHAEGAVVKHRLVYRLEGGTLVILACRYHDR
jgi:Txe/YoeB family toxin of Txe-Axe toxin-antitoxin module